jgi:chaperone required for assembly of F1-ATPase
MKRFYKIVSTLQGGDGYKLLLDGKPVKTSAGQVLCAPVKELADAVMAEWAAQAEEIRPQTMPLTQYLTTTLDRPANMEDDIRRHVLSYIDTDLLCYRTNEPKIYAARQSESWDPILKKIEENMGFSVLTTTELMAIRQPEEIHRGLEEYLKKLDPLSLTVFADVTEGTGSFFLTLVLRERFVTPETVFEAAQVEELLKAELYNEAIHGSAPDTEKKQESLRRMLAAASFCFEIL